MKSCGRLEAPSTFTQPYGSILIQSVKMQLLEPHHEKRHAPREHNAYGANSCYGCGSALCPLYEPIKASGHSKSKCMSPPSQVQRHKCRDKKCYGKCEEGEPKVCKYGYPGHMCVARQVTGIGCKRLGEKPTLMWLPWCEHIDVRSCLNGPPAKLGGASHTCRTWSSASTTRKCVLLCGVW